MRGSMAIRTRVRSVWRRVLGEAALVLCYHRVASVAHDPDGLAVSVAHFAEHIEAIARWRRCGVAGLTEAGRGRQGGILVTFDDAYRDNLLHAAPILAKHDVPAVIFAPSRLCREGEVYWWEVLRRLEAPESKADVEAVRELYYALARGAGDLAPADRKGGESAAGLRQRFVALLRSNGERTRQRFIEEGLRLIGWNGEADEGWPMNATELRQLSEGGLIEIGGHTRTHALLSSLTKEEQEEEIAGGKAELDAMLGRPTRCFAYPFGFWGDFNDLSIEAVRKAGYLAAFSFEPGVVTAETDRLRLGRFRVDDYDGEELMRRIRLWYGRPDRPRRSDHGVTA
jgi:peptidoglycan/xylan/chitin deacetylase (PgdA/CDA1 family)